MTKIIWTMALGIVFLLIIVLIATIYFLNKEPGSTRSELARDFEPDLELTYVGSAICGDCHDRIYVMWQTSLHSQVVKKAEDNPLAIQGNFKYPDYYDPEVTLDFTPEDVTWVHGVQWKQFYIDKDWHIRKLSWNMQAQRWEPYHVDDWQDIDWRERCAYCHVTGYDVEEKTFMEPGVGCEACHGPGSGHVDAPNFIKGKYIVNPAKLPVRLAAEICGQCHTRGKSPDGKHNFPINYRPGKQMTTEHFIIDDFNDKKTYTPDGCVRIHRQKYAEWATSKHAEAGVFCATCHPVHGSATKFATSPAQVLLCITCHAAVDTDSVVGHAPIYGAPQHSDCVTCHMPPETYETSRCETCHDAPLGLTTEPRSEHSHRFRVIGPERTMAYFENNREMYSLPEGGIDYSKLVQDAPNSCNLCHQHADLSNPVNWPDNLADARVKGKKFRFNSLVQ